MSVGEWCWGMGACGVVSGGSVYVGDISGRLSLWWVVKCSVRSLCEGKNDGGGLGSCGWSRRRG